jgi:kojibiose phosphorylase
MFIYTQPEIARNILNYRYQTLDGARHKAHRLGYQGAFYAWTSGKTGKELFPDFFFTDVLTGRKIRNHFNDWQIHISPDIVYALWQYYQATKDDDFLYDQGAEIVFEVARFLFSHAFFKKGKNRYEFIRLLGPDEYHENVDNNAFTNYQAHFALQKAVALYKQMEETAPAAFKAITEKIHLTAEEVAGWQDMVDLLYLPQPDEDSLLIEQFDGYFQLEDIKPEQLRERLIDPNEYWGWPNGIAVHTQVLKQADVVQLLALHDLFPESVVRDNYDYYEPRTEHGSSLSPSVHALVACKANHPETAYRYFKESATIDLYHRSKKVVSGDSFLGGIHTAACGVTWEIIVKGFAGFHWGNDSLVFHPHLPKNWQSLTFNLIIRGRTLTILIDHEKVAVEIVDGENPLSIQVLECEEEVFPGEVEEFPIL